MVEPALSIARSQGARVVASNYVDTVPDLTVATYFTSTKLAQDNPDLVKRFAAAMTEALTYADGHADEVRQVLTTYTKIDAAVLRSLTLPRWPTTVNKDSVRTLATLGQRDGVLSKAPDIDALFP